MKLIFKMAREIEEFATWQLKAYYVGSVDKNLIKLATEFGLENNVTQLVHFPEWVIPVCSLFAATYVVTKVLKAFFAYLLVKCKK
jgi:hypothetical protein